MSTSLIKIQGKTLMVILVSMAGLFALAVYLSWKSAEQYEEAGSATEIKPVVVDGKKVYGSLRGARFYEENKFVPMDAELIGNNHLKKST